MIVFLTTLRNFVLAVRRGLNDPPVPGARLPGGGAARIRDLFYWRVDGWTVIDSLYFSVITLTTAGYGDLSPCHAVEARIERQERRNTDGDEPRQT